MTDQGLCCLAADDAASIGEKKEEDYGSAVVVTLDADEAEMLECMRRSHMGSFYGEASGDDDCATGQPGGSTPAAGHLIKHHFDDETPDNSDDEEWGTGPAGWVSFY